MLPQERIFKYRASEKISEVVTILGVVILFGFFFDGLNGEFSSGTKIFLVLLISGFCIFFLNYSYVLNDHLKVSKEGICFYKIIGRSKNITFGELRRIVIRAKQNAFGPTHSAMTFFGPISTIQIIVTDLKDYSQFINLLKKEAIQNKFKIIHQGVNGEILDHSS